MEGGYLVRLPIEGTTLLIVPQKLTGCGVVRVQMNRVPRGAADRAARSTRRSPLIRKTVKRPIAPAQICRDG